MQIIKDKELCEDHWQLLSELTPETSPQQLPGGAVIVPYEYWQEHRDALLSRKPLPGVCVDGSVALEELLPDLPQLALIAIDFPVFTDGRGYSLARLLREQYQFRGEIRAVGDVLRDQLFFMMRCGINAFVLRKKEELAEAVTALQGFSVRYQPACDEPQPLYRRVERK